MDRKRIIKLRSLGLAVALTLASLGGMSAYDGSAVAASGNLLTNGDTESGATGWSAFGAGTPASNTSVVHGGTHSLAYTGRTAFVERTRPEPDLCTGQWRQLYDDRMDANAERNPERQGDPAGHRQRYDELHHPGAGRRERIRLDSADRDGDRILDRDVVLRELLRGDARRTDGFYVDDASFVNNSAGGGACTLPSSYRWTSTGALATPKSGWASLKDFTSVVYNGKHLVYATTHDNGSTWGSMNFGLFTNWSDMSTPPRPGCHPPPLRRRSSTSPLGVSGCWPPVGRDRLQLQDVDRSQQRERMVVANALFSGTISGSGTGPIDPDGDRRQREHVLFFAGDNGKIYRASMPIGNFPATSVPRRRGSERQHQQSVRSRSGLQDPGPEPVPHDRRGDRGQRQVLSARSRQPASRIVDGAGATESNPFAGKANSGATWTNDISHGDLVRNNPDQTMTVDPCNLQLL